LEAAFHCACLLGACFFALPLFSGAGLGFCQLTPAVSMLRWFTVYFLILWSSLIWVLLTGSRDDLCDPLPALLQGVAYHLPTLGLSIFPVFVYW
jgi:hypothetical protein